MRSFGSTLVDSIRENGQQFQTENYVSSPPAAWIVDSAANVWELGTKRYADVNALEFHQRYGTDPRGQFAFNVLVNGAETGEFASSIERRNDRIRIFTANGWKTWTGRSFF
jgi:hypothetical protein